jgi:Tfp pilus assembly protein PilE
MKRILIIISLVLLAQLQAIAQESYTVDGQSYSLKTEVDGAITLLWNTIDGDYRYFAKKENAITELKNSKIDGKYQQEFKESLQLLTTDNPVSTDKVNLTLVSLRNYINSYNKQVDPSFSNERPSIKLGARLGVFAGVSNAIFTQNPNNTLLPVVGIDFELIDEVKLKRHSVVLRLKQTFENNEFQYNATQASLNYRLKFVKTETLDIFLNTKFASYTYSSRDDFLVEDPNTGDIAQQSSSGGDFTAHGIFGLGADYKLGNGYLFFTYNDIVGLGLDSNNEFPLDFTLGYKITL